MDLSQLLHHSHPSANFYPLPYSQSITFVLPSSKYICESSCVGKRCLLETTPSQHRHPLATHHFRSILALPIFPLHPPYIHHQALQMVPHEPRLSPPSGP